MNIVVNGSKGKMGREIIAYLGNQDDYQVVGEVDIDGSLTETLASANAETVIDFSSPESRMEVVSTTVDAGCNAVIGTTGFTDDDLAEIRGRISGTDCCVFIAPNFNYGNVLMQQFAYQAAKHFDSAEIIEYHHNQKVDYPSGTAYKTAQGMAEVRDDWNRRTHDKVANIEGARGGDFRGIKVHAVRMPGFLAHQEVILGDTGQYLTIRHDVTSREAYMPGITMACRYAADHNGLVYGLETIL